jgi:hypothetical protein
MSLSPERILTHRKHRKDEEPSRIAKTKKDFALLVRDKAVEQFEAGHLDLTDKDTVPGIKAGLGAQSIINKEAAAQKNVSIEIGKALLQLISGAVAMDDDPLLIDDGLTIEGEAVEVDDEAD